MPVHSIQPQLLQLEAHHAQLQKDSEYFIVLTPGILQIHRGKIQWWWSTCILRAALLCIALLSAQRTASTRGGMTSCEVCKETMRTWVMMMERGHLTSMPSCKLCKAEGLRWVRRLLLVPGRKLSAAEYGSYVALDACHAKDFSHSTLQPSMLQASHAQHAALRHENARQACSREVVRKRRPARGLQSRVIVVDRAAQEALQAGWHR